MASRPVTDEEFKAALKAYCESSGSTASEGEDHGQKRFLLFPGDIIVRLEGGRIVTDSQSTYEKLAEILMDMRQAEPASAPTSEYRPAPKALASQTARSGQDGLIPASSRQDPGLTEYHRKKSSLYKTVDGSAPSAAMVNRAANAQGFNTDIIEFQVTDDLVRAHVRVTDPRTGQYQEDGVAFTKSAFIAKKTIDIIAKHIKKNPGLVAGLDPVTLRPELSDTAMIYDLPAKLFLAKEVLKSWNFLGRFAVTTAERRCKDKLLNAEFREQEEIDLEQAEMADVGGA
jgi:hypothetical protein